MPAARIKAILRSLRGSAKHEAEVRKGLARRKARTAALHSFVQQELQKQGIKRVPLSKQILLKHAGKVKRFTDAEDVARKKFFVLEEKKRAAAVRKEAVKVKEKEFTRRTGKTFAQHAGER